ncbi:unnamed protein product [Bursaphelenchus okinawaensis]|uniref:Membralin n=1 Tax=Bursaphelenchus okinawaensis TaxID=465554 RepID=A0A811K2N9_9BILA|nr:unnamed protein product [Bursaphelenchus okinawaensis]CAG9090848.1 unnamed protein product [Bursaphelenchus okinawaensis]
MADHRNGLVDLEVDIGNLGGDGANVGNGNQRLGTVRDRLFHAMVVKVAVSYNNHISQKWRTLIEFLVLSTALIMLFTLIYVHFTHSRYPGTCLNKIKHSWPKKGILRVEVIGNLQEFEEGLIDYSNGTTYYNQKYLLMRGPKFTPRDWTLRYRISDLQFTFAGDPYEEDDYLYFEPKVQPIFVYAVEYSLSHGLLKLSSDMRRYYNVEEMTYRIDGNNDVCLSSWKNRYLTRWLSGGIGEVIQSSLKSLAENETDKGYLKDLMHMEHYHFVTSSVSHYSYITAMLIMLIFTFAISMLLRFSHHQIFLFIIDLLQMFELNEPLVFPVAPLLTVILALVGMEAIMSEIFNDTSTAFYVILLVWMADQYDAICCRSSVSRKHWLRFFYLYHFAFYAYQYKFGGQYNIFALLTSAMFILHAMIYFFHHYEIPLILHQEQLLRVVGVAQQDASQRGNGELILVNRGAPTQPDQQERMENIETDEVISQPVDNLLDVEIVERVAPYAFRPNSEPIPTVHRNITFSERDQDGEHEGLGGEDGHGEVNEDLGNGRGGNGGGNLNTEVNGGLNNDGESQNEEGRLSKEGEHGLNGGQKEVVYGQTAGEQDHVESDDAQASETFKRVKRHEDSGDNAQNDRIVNDEHQNTAKAEDDEVAKLEEAKQDSSEASVDDEERRDESKSKESSEDKNYASETSEGKNDDLGASQLSREPTEISNDSLKGSKGLNVDNVKHSASLEAYEDQRPNDLTSELLEALQHPETHQNLPTEQSTATDHNRAIDQSPTRNHVSAADQPHQPTTSPQAARDVADRLMDNVIQDLC